MTTLRTLRRYPGAKPFTTEEQDIFFGRRDAVRQLCDRIRLEPLMVLYGKSGLGKSSLINAGVLPEMEKNGQFKAFTFRFGAFTEEKTDTPLGISLERLRPASSDGLLEKILPGDESLWRCLKARQRGVISEEGGGDISSTKGQHRELSPARSSQMTAPHTTGFLLVFDQFEELFTYPPAQVEQFAQQLAELLFTTIPARYREALDKTLEANPKAFKTRELGRLAEPFTLRVLMAIRSDRMSLLNRLTDYLPNVLKNCFELGPLDRAAAEEAILAPAYRPGEQYISPQFDYSDEALHHILDFLTDGGNDPVESFQLQILCQTLEDKVIENNLRTVGMGDIGDPRSIYEHYYDNQISRIADPVERLAARRFIEEGLIFEEEERRLSVYEGVIYRQYRISPELLRQLVDSHLIRAEASITQSGYTYELSHDTLVAPVLKAKATRVAEEKKEAEERARKRLEEELEKQRAMEEAREKMEMERRKRIRVTLLALVGFLLSVISIAALVYALGQRQQAEVARAQAEKNLNRFYAEQILRRKLEVDVLLREADTYAAAFEYALALKKLEEAYTIDSVRVDIKNKIFELKKLVPK